MTILQTLIGLIAAERLLEFALSRRNAARLVARGGVEIGGRDHRLLGLVQMLWLVAIAVLVPATRQPFAVLIALFGLLQFVRLWVILSLGEHWTLRLVALPEPPVRRGPYRWLAHPDYVVITAEIALLPLAFGAWELALVFTLANAVLLGRRVRLENRVLAARALTAIPAGARVRPARNAA